MTAHNINELRQELLQMFDDLKNNKISIVTASAMNNTAGRIIDTAKIQLEYYKLIKEKPDFVFLVNVNKEQKYLPDRKIQKEIKDSHNQKIEFVMWECVSCGKEFADKAKPEQCTCGSMSIIMKG